MSPPPNVGEGKKPISLPNLRAKKQELQKKDREKENHSFSSYAACTFF